jgi:hypothetical protein
MCLSENNRNMIRKLRYLLQAESLWLWDFAGEWCGILVWPQCTNSNMPVCHPIFYEKNDSLGSRSYHLYDIFSGLMLRSGGREKRTCEFLRMSCVPRAKLMETETRPGISSSGHSWMDPSCWAASCLMILWLDIPLLLLVLLFVLQARIGCTPRIARYNLNETGNVLNTLSQMLSHKYDILMFACKSFRSIESCCKFIDWLHYLSKPLCVKYLCFVGDWCLWIVMAICSSVRTMFSGSVAVRCLQMQTCRQTCSWRQNSWNLR